MDVTVVSVGVVVINCCVNCVNFCCYVCLMMLR